MKKINYIIFFVFTLFLAISLPARAALSRAELRELWRALPKATETTYAEVPSAKPPYEPGALSAETLADALAYANFLRGLAGLESVALDEALTAQAQRAALIMAANGALSHSPERPAEFPPSLYEEAAVAAARSNLAMFNWSEPGLLRLALEVFSQDDGAINATALGHRRWLLSPRMGVCGFGMANDAEGRTYAAMYVLDRSRDPDYDLICWPPEGAFPAELLTQDTPWSISPNPARYDLERSAPSIALTGITSGVRHEFPAPFGSPGDGAFFTTDSGRYGDGPAYIFRPEFSGGYRQNQRWRVELSGMVSAEGLSLPPVVYEVEIASLTPIDPADVEIDAPPESLLTGETVALIGRVVPDWADDLSLEWSVDRPEIAAVDEYGVLAARAEGEVIVTARAVNGRAASVTVRVGAAPDH